MLTWLFWLMLVTALLDWVASWQGWQKVRWISKPGTLLLLIAWFTQIGQWNGDLIWFGVALVFSLLGDILLNIPDQRLFLPGAAAFLLAHAMYIIGFFQQPLTLEWKIVLPLLLVGSAFGVVRAHIQKGMATNHETQMKVPTTIYELALSVMWLSAISTLFRPGWPLVGALMVSVGGGLFFLSDALLASNRFVRPLRAADLLVMTTYHLGQFLIVGGALQHFLGG